MKKVIFAAAACLMLAAVAKAEPYRPMQACATDVKHCADGSFVGRDAMSGCEYKKCPEESAGQKDGADKSADQKYCQNVACSGSTSGACLSHSGCSWSQPGWGGPGNCYGHYCVGTKGGSPTDSDAKSANETASPQNKAMSCNGGCPTGYYCDGNWCHEGGGGGGCHPGDCAPGYSCNVHGHCV